MFKEQLSTLKSCFTCKHAVYHPGYPPTRYDPGEEAFCDCANEQIEWTEALDHIVYEHDQDYEHILPHHCGGFERADLLTLWRRFTNGDVDLERWSESEGFSEEEINQALEALREEIEKMIESRERLYAYNELIHRRASN